MWNNQPKKTKRQLNGWELRNVVLIAYEKTKSVSRTRTLIESNTGYKVTKQYVVEILETAKVKDNCDSQQRQSNKLQLVK